MNPAPVDKAPPPGSTETRVDPESRVSIKWLTRHASKHEQAFQTTQFSKWVFLDTFAKDTALYITLYIACYFY